MIDLAKTNKNYVLKKVRSITVEDRATGEQKVSLVQLKNIGLSTSQDFTDATGKDNVTLARFETAKKATITASSGMVSTNYLAMQLGAEIESVKGKSGLVRVTEVIETTDGTSVTLKNKAQGTLGNEIKWIYAEEFGAAGQGYKQHSSADATRFKYDAGTKVITLPTGVFKSGDKIVVTYYPKFTEVERIVNSANNYSAVGRVIIDAYFTDPCDDQDVLVQIKMERGKISGALDLQFGDQAAVQNIEIEALTNVCDQNQSLFEIYIYDMDNVTDL